MNKCFKNLNRSGNYRNKQGGNIILLILGAILLVGGLVVFLTSGNSNSTNTSSASSQVIGSSVMADASSVKDMFDQLVGYKLLAPTSITFVPGTASPSNLLDTAAGLQKPISNANAYINTTFPNGAWIYQTGLKVNGIGTAAAEFSLVTVGVKDTVCQQINNSLWGSTAIPASTLASTAFTTGAALATPTSASAADISAIAGVSGWNQGCVTTTAGADNNAYFLVLKPM